MAEGHHAAGPGRRAQPLARGAWIGRYQIVGELGSGGMGVVYRAHDAELGRDVALKLVTTHASEGDSQGRARLLREAQALAQIKHPNVIAVHDVGRFEEGVFLAMELVEGQRFDAWMKTPHHWREVLRVFREAGRGLEAAHAVGLLHRDFKPSNLMLAADGRVRVLDFGLARARDPGRPPPPSSPSNPRLPSRDELPTVSGTTPREPDTGEHAAPVPQPLEPTSSSPNLLLTSVTRLGAIVGTPPYMAPEQHDGRVGDERSDQFSFCVTFWQVLHGERPFAGANVGELMQNIQLGKVRPAPPGVRVPGWIRQILLRGLSVEPAARWPSMSSLLEALARDPAQRRRRIGSAAAAVVLAGTAAFGLWRGRANRVCAGAEAQLAGVWDAARKQLVSGAFEKTGKPFAAAAWQAVERALDGYAAAWVKMHTDACEATRVRGEQSAELMDLRMTCLQQRLDEVRAQVEVFGAADGEVVERAASAAQSLNPLESCADAAALKSTTPMPVAVERRARVIEVQKKVAKVKALQESGRIADAKKLAEPAVAEARALDYRPIEAEALLYLGRVQDAAGDYAAAVKSYKDAEVAAEASRYDEVAALAATSVVWVTGERLGKYAEAHELERDARAKIERVGREERMLADLESKLGTIYFEEGKYDLALEHGRRALATRERVLPADHPMLASSLGELGDVAVQLANYDEALRDYRRALVIAEKSLGPEHPQVGSLRTNLAAALRMQGRYEEALAEYGRARAICEKALGPDHPTLATIFVNVGGIERSQRKWDDAQKSYRRALAIWEKALGPEHPSTGTAHYHLGTLYVQAGRTDEALAQFRRALGIWQKALGPEHPSLSAAYTGIGDAELQRGRAKEALVEYTRAVKLVEKAVGPDHPDLADGLTSMGEAWLTLNQPAKAAGALERALKLREKSPGDPLDLARTRFALARALGKSARSGELAKRAREAYASNAQAKKEVGEIDAWLAR